MPRASARTQKSAGSDALDGCVITFADSRTSVIPTQHASLYSKQFSDIEKDITDRKGQYTSKIIEATHVIATSTQYEKKLQKVKLAISLGLHLVNIDWLVDSLESKTRVDEAQYKLDNQSDTSKVATNSQQQTTDASTKDEEDANADSADSLPQRTKSGSKTLKRSREQSDDDQDAAKKTKTTKEEKEPVEADSEAKSGKARIPVDDSVPGGPTRYEVCVNANDGAPWDATLNQTNAGNNNNKFYRIQVLKHTSSAKYFCWTRWGRVGENGQSKLIDARDAEHAEREFQKKFKDKNGNSWEMREQPPRSGKYTFIELNYEESSDDDDDGNNDDKETNKADQRRSSNASSTKADIKRQHVESTLDKPVQRLMQFIFNTEFIKNTLADLNYDAAKMPLGKLSKKTLLRGYEVLKEMAAIVGSANQGAVSQAQGASLQDLSNQYFSLIPHDFRRNRPPTINSMDMIQKEITVLENLTDMQLANEIMKHAKDDKDEVDKINVLDRQFQGLGMREMSALDPKSDEFQELENYLHKTSAANHYMKQTVQDIFRVERNGEHDRFKNSEYSKIPKKQSDRRLLWHGSRTTNYGGILSQGLRIAPKEAPVSGYMFGKGVYMADMSTKSANYCCSGMSNDTGLLLLCEVELGTPSLRLGNADYNAGDRAKAQNSISTLGIGSHAPPKWKDAACVNKDLNGVKMPDLKHEPCDTKDANAGLAYNEYIVYDVAQIKLRYLLRVEMKHQYN